MDYHYQLPEGRSPEAGPPPEQAPSPGPYWGGWATFGFGLVIFIITLVVQVIVGFIVAFVYVLVQEGAGVDLAAIPELIEDYFGVISAIAVIFNALIGTGLIWLIIKAKRRLPFTEYLGFRKMRPRTFFLLLLVFGAFYGFLVIINILAGQAGEGSSDLALYSIDIWPALVWISFVVFAPLYEEIWMRGFLFEGFARSRIGVTGAIILTSLFWAAQHVQYSWFQMGLIFAFGLVLGLVRWKTKSLWAPIFLHVLNNAIAMMEITFLGT